MNPMRITAGFVLVALGIVLLLERLGYVNAGEIIGNWWPLAIVVLGAAQWVGQPRSVGPALLVVIGILMLVGELELVPGGAWSIVWPFVLITVGVWILVRRQGWPARALAAGQETFDRFVAFGGLDLTSQARAFRTGSLTALFGGIKMDFREAALAPEGANLDLVAAFGGVEVRVPEGWRVNVSGLPLFGGIENKTLHNGQLPADAPTLNVQATALFGGIEVRH